MEKPKIINKSLDIDSGRLKELKKDQTVLIIVHHTGVNIDQAVETIHNYHKKDRGWAGIGYHFYIRFNGDIYKGRPITKRGAHTKGYNDRSIGVALAGDFSKESLIENRKEQYEALVELLKWLKNKYPDASVKFHDDFASTSCPGNNFPKDRLLDDITINSNNDNNEGNNNDNNGNEDNDDNNDNKDNDGNNKIHRVVEGTFDGEKIEEQAFLINDRTYIPVRLLEKWFPGVQVEWDEEEGKFHVKT
ncbi:N-acetylmuramoyl-L-alanine amidase [Natranaerofaba carboxydovora]|uniref:N-acetylmuramoyl-L-alanine amidase n=1 Tax=Natranaerofaba carboxydovora TaxID=2742683 RepID=UPI001F1352BF|nr:N-acetylmuramoyl-L-alanine amidase [Natranaerofaba carboxydovora]UMZ74926.1 N-acetylmuramoyl-L-alanine amidase [Natranaerofaba carboxydovora]